ncbi:MAG: cytochrome c maturation protein CcmE [Proteobacteria bacterium]|nr:cytochrome c maturation protein CcmE [Pseudomonadota bacterium]
MNKKGVKILVGGMLIIGIIVALFASISSENMTYYFTPAEILAEPLKFQTKKIRVMGLVRQGSLVFEPKETKSKFQISEDSQTFLNVAYQGPIPDMFKEGQGVVVEGTMQGTDQFTANTLLVKHSEEYKVEEHQSKKKNYYNSLAN